MIGYLRGRVKYIFADGCVLDVRDVGYKIILDRRTLSKLDVGAELELLIHTTFSSDAITLYGFERQADYDLFARLITVSGIGAKTALGMLSRMSAEELVGAIGAKNVALLTTLPGLGKKSAERLVLELHDKLKDAAIGSSVVDQRAMLDATDALEALGYSRAEIASVLSKVDATLSTEDLIKLALRSMK